ncbi:MAG: sulfite exporter TauE/SafE family protein, partial [Thermoanaerobacteraceae bacterium]|nr:sulfite exporter TauE/SafE family protein [Thermoanaerobacteraceae bacterium]
MIYYFLIANFLGGFVQGATGFGFALVTMSILPLFMDLTDLTIVTILLGLVVNFSIIYSLKGGVNFKVLLTPLITSIIGRQIGTFILLGY